jgi:hypothetical protein
MERTGIEPLTSGLKFCPALISHGQRMPAPRAPTRLTRSRGGYRHTSYYACVRARGRVRAEPCSGAADWVPFAERVRGVGGVYRNARARARSQSAEFADESS